MSNLIIAMTKLSDEYQAIHPRVEKFMVGGMNHFKTHTKQHMTEGLFRVIADKKVTAFDLVDGVKVYRDIPIVDIKRIDKPKPKAKDKSNVKVC